LELELKRRCIAHYETVLDITASHEETMEMIVPDAYPDILRIIDTDGVVCIRSREVRNGEAEVSGTVKTHVLYVPESGAGLCRLALDIPFTHRFEGAGLDTRSFPVVTASLRAADARSINPRKILARVDVLLCLKVLRPGELEISTGAEAPSETGLQVRMTQEEAWFVTGVSEKVFSFSDDVPLPAGRPEAKTILKTKAELECQEAKRIGQKLVLKGEARLWVLYEGGRGFATAPLTLPFSQIMEMSGASEGAECAVALSLTELDVDPAPESVEGHALSVSLQILAQATATETIALPLLTDLYSTAFELAPARAACSLRTCAGRNRSRQTVRELLETTELPQSVLDAHVRVGAVQESGDGESRTVQAEVEITVVYLGEDGGVLSAMRRLTVSASMDAMGAGRACAYCEGEVFAAPSAEGVEARFTICFERMGVCTRKCMCVSGVPTENAVALDRAGRPSVVLRMPDDAEDLWSLAKAYHTTPEDILVANGLDAEAALPRGRLLLIPKRR